MTSTNPAAPTTIRLPGVWTNPRELTSRLSDEFRHLDDKNLFLPDGAEISAKPVPADELFKTLFTSSCQRRPPTEEELAMVRDQTMNVVLTGPGGSLDAARTMLQVGAAIVRAGGAGVFILNSMLAHGGGAWLKLADDASTNALCLAFVSSFSGPREIWTLGMRVLGFPDLVMRRSDGDCEAISNVVRAIAARGKPLDDEPVFLDRHGLPRYRAARTAADEYTAGGLMENPFGRLWLSSTKEIAESN